MKIINISLLKLNDRHNYYGGAIGNIAYNLLKSLAEIGIDVVTFTEGLDLEKDPPENLKFLKVNNFKEMFKIVKELPLNDFSIVTHLYFHEPEYNPIAERIKKLPFVIGMCELPHPRLSDEVKGILKFRLIREVGKRIITHRFKKTLKICDELIVVNKGAKEYYSRFIDEDKIKIAPYGVDLERFKYSPMPDEPKILMVSRLIKRRGVDNLVKALPMVLEDCPDAELHFVGEGPRKLILREIAKRLNVSDRVFFHGKVSPEKLVKIYKDCYVFCHLSFADGWNQPALEAMATGRPVICTNAPHNSMVEDGKTGYLVPYNDVCTLAERLIYLLNDKKLAEKMGRKARRKVEIEHDWREIAKRYRKYFMEVLI